MSACDSPQSPAQFLSAEPFPHMVVDRLLSPELLSRAAEEFDEIPSQDWVQYDSPDEHGKRTFNRLTEMPVACREAFDWILSPEAVEWLGRLTGLEGLHADPTLYGGGLQVTEAGGFLGLHLDNERHPQTGFARRLNLVVYCTPGWRDEWGGELELWSRDRSRPVVKIVPRFGRAALFETSNHSYHGQPQPLRCPANVTRKSLCVFYWSPPRARARFVSVAGEMFDARIEAARIARSA